MNADSLTMPVMGKAKKDKPEATKVEKKGQNRSPAVTIFARIDVGTGKDFLKYVDSIRPKTTATAVIEMLIEEHLQKLKAAGLWPPQQPD